MATSDDKRAVSTENAKKMFNNILAEIIDRTNREVLFAGYQQSTMFVCPSDEYSQIYIETMHSASSTVRTITVPVKSGEYPITFTGTQYLKVNVRNDDVVSIGFLNSPNYYYIVRAVGIRNGGQFLADLLDALHLGEVE